MVRLAQAADDDAMEATVTAPRRLTRSADDRYLAGVAGGVGRYLGVDPVLLRIAFVALVFLGGSGIVLYGVSWLLVPDEGSDRALAAGAMAAVGHRRRGIAVAVVA